MPVSTPTNRVNLLDLSFDALQRMVVEWGYPRFRATQIWRWIYHTVTSDPEEMTNLPQEFRDRLRERTCVDLLRVLNRSRSPDGLTDKVLFETSDRQIFEAVLMRYTERNTICASSQIGCPLGCSFCATGHQGFMRSLTTGEISAQVLHFAQELRKENAHITNVVFMGMGEPMLNFDAVWQAIRNLNDPEGMSLGARRFTISTVGIVPGIERMARESLAVGLAISLHAPDNALRDAIIPANKRYPLERLLDATKLYIERTGRRVTFEYALIDGLNDSDQHAHRTAQLLQGLLCHVNLIPMNPTIGCDYEPSPRERMLRFQEILVKQRIQTTVRLRRGLDVDAGCGQLRSRYGATPQEETARG